MYTQLCCFQVDGPKYKEPAGGCGALPDADTIPADSRLYFFKSCMQGIYIHHGVFNAVGISGFGLPSSYFTWCDFSNTAWFFRTGFQRGMLFLGWLPCPYIYICILYIYVYYIYMYIIYMHNFTHTHIYIYIYTHWGQSAMHECIPVNIPQRNLQTPFRIP